MMDVGCYYMSVINGAGDCELGLVGRGMGRFSGVCIMDKIGFFMIGSQIVQLSFS